LLVTGDFALVSIQLAARMLKPLDNPPPSSVKYFAGSKPLEQMQDRTWLAKVTNALKQHWQKRNATKNSDLLRILKID
jgi:hypothetical protein